MRGVKYKPIEGQPLGTSTCNDSKSHSSGVAMNNQDGFVLTFDHLGQLIHFWEEYILNSINKQHFSNERFVCSADGVIVPFK
jgi:hypothetical protein